VALRRGCRRPYFSAASATLLNASTTSVAVEQVAARFREYVEYGRAAVEFRKPGLPPASKPQGGRRREMTDDFLTTIAKQYNAYSEKTGRAVTDIAAAHGVKRSTASRWVATARERGFLPAKEASDAS
jgi:hypothetical protein